MWNASLIGRRYSSLEKMLAPADAATNGAELLELLRPALKRVFPGVEQRAAGFEADARAMFADLPDRLEARRRRLAGLSRKRPRLEAGASPAPSAGPSVVGADEGSSVQLRSAAGNVPLNELAAVHSDSPMESFVISDDRLPRTLQEDASTIDNRALVLAMLTAMQVGRIPLAVVLTVSQWWDRNGNIGGNVTMRIDPRLNDAVIRETLTELERLGKVSMDETYIELQPHPDSRVGSAHPGFECEQALRLLFRAFPKDVALHPARYYLSFGMTCLPKLTRSRYSKYGKDALPIAQALLKRITPQRRTLSHMFAYDEIECAVASLLSMSKFGDSDWKLLCLTTATQVIGHQSTSPEMRKLNYAVQLRRYTVDRLYSKLSLEELGPPPTFAEESDWQDALETLIIGDEYALVYAQYLIDCNDLDEADVVLQRFIRVLSHSNSQYGMCVKSRALWLCANVYRYKGMYADARKYCLRPEMELKDTTILRKNSKQLAEIYLEELNFEKAREAVCWGFVNNVNERGRRTHNLLLAQLSMMKALQQYRKTRDLTVDASGYATEAIKGFASVLNDHHGSGNGLSDNLVYLNAALGRAMIAHLTATNEEARSSWCLVRDVISDCRLWSLSHLTNIVSLSEAELETRPQKERSERLKLLQLVDKAVRVRQFIAMGSLWPDILGDLLFDQSEINSTSI